MSGTPLHGGMVSLQQYSSYSSEAYASLLHCLNAEQRKAGGYLQNHLETLENKVCVHMLLYVYRMLYLFLTVYIDIFTLLAILV